MKINVGKLDRVARVIVGAGLVAWAATSGPVWAWIGVIPLATGAIGMCPLYSLVGINTCPRDKS
ncbi:MAG: DUF2892 domain-containing protein [Lysobacteraceae bacterium]|mgnify:CR=1 FL=1|nr:DUF2892 domain-containing protein [Xanthomonadales bacterium]HPF73921.1 DUF2892 domain-containing protein [Xanthomonadaceae bacterium]HRX99563.1 DUF2892 domain-containing protein [Xanthomonadaceae bacterium]